jgi:hypothetical protein
VSCVLFDDFVLDSKIKWHCVQSLRFAARCRTGLVGLSLSAAVTRQPHNLISVLSGVLAEQSLTDVTARVAARRYHKF